MQWNENAFKWTKLKYSSELKPKKRVTVLWMMLTRLLFLLKEVESVQSNLLQTIDFHHGYKGKFLSPRFNFGSLVKAWQRGLYLLFWGSGPSTSPLSGCQNIWHLDALFFKREKARVRQKQENGNLGSIKQAFKKSFQARTLSFLQRRAQ